MMVANYVSLIQREINTAFMNFLQRKYPDKDWTKTWDGELSVTVNEDAVYDAVVNTTQPEWVDPHWRRNKNGGQVLVKGYWKQPKQLTAIDVATIEAKAENSSNIGVDITQELEEFVQALTSNQIQLGNMNFKGL